MEDWLGFVLFVIAAAVGFYLFWRFVWKRPERPTSEHVERPHPRDVRGNDGHGGRDR